jgi:hypothetical protein
VFEDDLSGIPRARNSDPETSHEAAEQLTTAESHCRAMLREAWLISLTDTPLFTDEILAEYAGLREQGICWWHRCSDLRELGMIKWAYDKSGRQRKMIGSNGRRVGISRITVAGKAVAQEQLPMRVKPRKKRSKG